MPEKNKKEIIMPSAGVTGQELTKIICENPRMLIGMYEEGALKDTLPELCDAFECPQNNMYHIYDVGTHCVITAENAPHTPVMRWAALLHDIGKPACRTTDAGGIDHFYGHAAVSADMAAKILDRLGFEKNFASEVFQIIALHCVCTPTQKSAGRFIRTYGAEAMSRHLYHRLADSLAHSPACIRTLLSQLLTEADAALEAAVKIRQAELAKGPALAVSGTDIMELGVPEGPEVGRILAKCREAAEKNPSLNRREVLLEIASEIAGA